MGENIATKGLTELRKLAEQGKKLFESRCQKIKTYIFENNTASIVIDYEGVLNADLPDGSKTGEIIRLKGKSNFTFKDGKIVSLTDYC